MGCTTHDTSQIHQKDKLEIIAWTDCGPPMVKSIFLIDSIKKDTIILFKHKYLKRKNNERRFSLKNAVRVVGRRYLLVLKYPEGDTEGDTIVWGSIFLEEKK